MLLFAVFRLSDLVTKSCTIARERLVFFKLADYELFMPIVVTFASNQNAAMAYA